MTRIQKMDHWHLQKTEFRAAQEHFKQTILRCEESFRQTFCEVLRRYRKMFPSFRKFFETSQKSGRAGRPSGVENSPKSNTMNKFIDSSCQVMNHYSSAFELSCAPLLFSGSSTFPRLLSRRSRSKFLSPNVMHSIKLSKLLWQCISMYILWKKYVMKSA